MKCDKCGNDLIVDNDTGVKYFKTMIWCPVCTKCKMSEEELFKRFGWRKSK